MYTSKQNHGSGTRYISSSEETCEVNIITPHLTTEQTEICSTFTEPGFRSRYFRQKYCALFEGKEHSETLTEYFYSVVGSRMR
jgi:hypothetical protein